MAALPPFLFSADGAVSRRNDESTKARRGEFLRKRPNLSALLKICTISADKPMAPLAIA
jgi:hypothetical protein